MRVLHLINSYAPGGAELFVCALAQAMRSAGADAIVCAAGSAGADAERTVRTRVGGMGVRALSLVDRGERGWLERGRRLRELIRADAPDVVHLHVLTPVALAATFLPVPSVFTAHSEHHVGSARRRAALVERALCATSDAVVTVSEAAKATLTGRTRLAPGRVAVIPNGIDLARFPAPVPAERPALGVPIGTRLAVVVARVDENKGHDLVLAALHDVRRRGVDLHVAFAGRLDAAPAFVARLRATTRSRGLEPYVHFLGAVDDVPSLLAAADVAVTASRSESFGIAAVEAMAAGVPLVTSDIPAHREISDGGRHARLFRAGDVGALGDALAEVLAADRPGVTAAARAHAAARYDIAAVARAHLALYERLAASGAAALAPRVRS